MVSPINSALAGISAATKRLEVSADNIANQFSSNYVPKKVDQVSLSNGAIQSLVKPVNNPTVLVPDPDAPDAGADGFVRLPNVDIANELVNQAIAAYDYKANLKTIQIARKLDESLLDIFS